MYLTVIRELSKKIRVRTIKENILWGATFF